MPYGNSGPLGDGAELGRKGTSVGACCPRLKGAGGLPPAPGPKGLVAGLDAPELAGVGRALRTGPKGTGAARAAGWNWRTRSRI